MRVELTRDSRQCDKGVSGGTVTAATVERIGFIGGGGGVRMNELQMEGSDKEIRSLALLLEIDKKRIE